MAWSFQKNGLQMPSRSRIRALSRKICMRTFILPVLWWCKFGLTWHA